LVKTDVEEDSGGDLDEAIQSRAGEERTRPAPGHVTTSKRPDIVGLVHRANTLTICPRQMEMGDGILEDDYLDLRRLPSNSKLE